MPNGKDKNIIQELHDYDDGPTVSQYFYQVEEDQRIRPSISTQEHGQLSAAGGSQDGLEIVDKGCAIDSDITASAINLLDDAVKQQQSSETLIIGIHRKEITYHGSSELMDLPVQINRNNASRLSQVVQRKMKYFSYNPHIKTSKLRAVAMNKLKHDNINLHGKSQSLKNVAKQKLDTFAPTLHKKSEGLKLVAMNKLDHTHFDV